MRRTYLITGATSGIARAIGRGLAAEGHRLVLAGRSESELERLAVDLNTRYSVPASHLRFDAAIPEEVESLPERSRQMNEGIDVDGVFLVQGILPAQEQTEADANLFRLMLDVNFTSSAILGQLFAQRFSERGSGLIVGISSVAGDRGRGSNFHYGSTKAAFTVFLDGLRHRFHRSGVQILTVKPGFVDTPMTLGLVNTDSLLCASPERIAEDILRAVRHRKNRLYTKRIWGWIMIVVRNIPERIFLRSRL